MNCRHCHRPLDPGAAYCGNCGQAVVVDNSLSSSTHTMSKLAIERTLQAVRGDDDTIAATTGSSLTFNDAAIPSYALATPQTHNSEIPAVLSVVCGIAGIAGAGFVALVGLGFGIAGLVLGTTAYAKKRKLSTVGIVFSSLAIIVGLAVWAYAIKHDSLLRHNNGYGGGVGSAATSASIGTPCYSAGFVDSLTIQNSKGSCDMNAYNGRTLDGSTNAYKIYANQIPLVNNNNFSDFAKQALEKDIRSSLPNFHIVKEEVVLFADSPAYIVTTASPSKNVSLIEAAVFHPVQNGENVFILVHAVNGKAVDLRTIEAEWLWR